jgi:type II secretory pathway predicted ATPase ExeA
MLSDVRNYYGLAKDFGQAGYFETEDSEQIVRELKLEIKTGKLLALSGIIGSGKSTMLRRTQEALAQDKEILVSKSLSVEKGQISLATLIMALFYDLAIEKDFKIPTQPERRERALRDLIRKRQRPIALFIDDAHDLHSKTLIGLKRLIEVVRDSGGTLSVVLAGHPKLKNDLRRPSMEEIGSRATIFELEGLGSEKRTYIKWLLTQSTAPKTKIEGIITEDALATLTEKLSTPLQFEFLSDSCRTVDERIAVMATAVKTLMELESRVSAAIDAGTQPKVNLPQVRQYRLETEIELAKLQSAPKS